MVKKDFVCKVCKTTFSRDYVGKEIKYCSMACYSANGKKAVVCNVCKKIFFCNKSQDRLFCSRECAFKGKKPKEKHDIKSICVVCRKDIFDWRKRITCSISCAGKHHKELIKMGLAQMPSKEFILEKNDLKRKKQNYQGTYDQKVYRRICGVDKCALCERTDWIDAHHIDKNRSNNKKSNLIALCRKHHPFVEKNCVGWAKKMILKYLKEKRV